MLTMLAASAGTAVGLTVAQATPAGATPITAVTLTASATSVEVGTSVTFTATVNGDLAPGQYIDIINVTDGYFVASCEYPDPDRTCSGEDYYYEPGTYTYIAYVDNDPEPNIPPNGVVASSNPVSVTWYAPPPPPVPDRASDAYCPSPTPIITGNTLGIQHKVVLQSGNPTALCVRIDSGGLGYGGALVINTGSTGLPTTDSDISGCSFLVDESILGQRVAIGTGSTTGEFWLCLQAGPTTLRVKVPTGGLPSVDWYGDDGSHIGTSGGGGGGVPGVPSGDTSCSSSRSAVIGVPRLCIITSPPLPVL
jgi:hypothetical protein